MSKKPDAVILAAGRSTRFGTDKLLHIFQNKTLIEHTVKPLLDCCNRIVIVSLSKRIQKLRKIPSLTKCTFVLNELAESDKNTSMFSSILTGLKYLFENTNSNDAAAFILPGDCCQLSPGTIETLWSTYDEVRPIDAVVPTYRDKRGHPVLLGNTIISKILESKVDTRLDWLLLHADVHLSQVNDPGILQDIDYRSDLFDMKKG